MMEEDKDIELLEGYLENTLSPEDNAAVETRLRTDSDLHQLLADLKILRASIRENSRVQLKQELIDIENALSEKPEAKSVSFRPWLIGVAASVVLIVATFLLWPKPTNTQELFAQYFEPYPNVIMPTVRGDLEPDTTLMAKAYRAYDSGDYEKAITFFEQVKAKDEGVYLYLGNSYLADNEPEKAIVCFEKVINDFEVFDEQAEWYLSMCYIRAGDLKKAKDLLNTIASKEGSYKIKAEQVLPQLKL